MVARLPQLRSFEPQNALIGFREGRDDAQRQQSRNALLRAGQAAAGGDFDAAAGAAFEGGQLQAGTALRGIGIEDQKREVDQLARLAIAADTPEKMQQAAQAVAQKFGPERAQQFLATPRDQLIAEAQTVSQQLEQQFRESQAGRAQANADRTFGLQEQRVGLERDRVGLAEQTLQAQRGAGKFASPVSVAAQKEENKLRIKEQQELKGRARGAESFLKKVDRLERLVQQGGDEAFGPISGSESAQFAARVFGTDTQKLRDQIQAALSDLELDVARFKLKGQGQVTEAERKIARDTIGGLTVTDAETQLNILNQLKQEAQDAVAQSRGGQPAQQQQAPQSNEILLTPGGVQFRIVP